MDRGREQRLVLRAQSGDREAYDELLCSLQERLFGYLRGLVYDRTLAEDVLQEVYVLVYRKLRWLREPALFRPWLYRLATREGLRQLKRRRQWKEIPLDEDPALLDPAALPELRDAKLIARLPELLAAVSPASRAVLLLHYAEELSLEEVAETLALSLGTVKSRLSYGLAGLRKQLGLDQPQCAPARAVVQERS